VEEVLFEAEGVFVGADQVRYEILMSGIVVENLDVLGGLNEELGAARRRRSRTNEKKSRETSRDLSPDPKSQLQLVA
jgi:hypothetical protein